MIYYKPRWFDIEELVPPQLFEQFKDRQHILWQQLDPRILWSGDNLRDMFGPATVNSWLWGGRFEQSGLRTPDSQHYSPTSQHSHGRGLDLKFNNVDYEELRQFIIHNPQDERLQYITCIELDTPTWLHIDCRNWDKTSNGVLQVPWK